MFNLLDLHDTFNGKIRYVIFKGNIQNLTGAAGIAKMCRFCMIHPNEIEIKRMHASDMQNLALAPKIGTGTSTTPDKLQMFVSKH